MYSVTFVFLLIFLLQGFFIGLITSRNVEENIIRGRPAGIGEAKYQVYLDSYFTIHNETGTYKMQGTCGGTIVSAHHVITAAHCIPPNGYINVHFGVISKTSPKFKHSFRKASKIIKHPNYYKVTQVHLTVHDIAIIELDSKLPRNKFVAPIPLATKKPKYGDICTISGWGETDQKDKFPDTLMIGRTTITTCDNNEKYNVCSTFPLAQPLQGDSGGPLICKGKLAGVVSFGPEDGWGTETYTDITSHLGWLKENGINVHF